VKEPKEKKEIIAKLRQCPAEEIKPILLGYIAERKLPEKKDFDADVNYFNNVLLGNLEQQAEALSEGDVENACRIAVRTWGSVRRRGYWITSASIPDSKRRLFSYLRWHDEYEGLEEELAAMRCEAEKLEENDLAGFCNIACRLQRIMHRYFFSYVNSEGREEIVEPTWVEAIEALGYKLVIVPGAKALDGGPVVAPAWVVRSLRLDEGGGRQ
jgi:hypothetical protein